MEPEVTTPAYFIVLAIICLVALALAVHGEAKTRKARRQPPCKLCEGTGILHLGIMTDVPCVCGKGNALRKWKGQR